MTLFLFRLVTSVSHYTNSNCKSGRTNPCNQSLSDHIGSPQQAPATLRVSGFVAAWFGAVQSRLQKLAVATAAASADGATLKQRLKCGPCRPALRLELCRVEFLQKEITCGHVSFDLRQVGLHCYAAVRGRFREQHAAADHLSRRLLHQAVPAAPLRSRAAHLVGWPSRGLGSHFLLLLPSIAAPAPGCARSLYVVDHCVCFLSRAIGAAIGAMNGVKAPAAPGLAGSPTSTGWGSRGLPCARWAVSQQSIS